MKELEEFKRIRDNYNEKLNKISEDIKMIEKELSNSPLNSFSLTVKNVYELMWDDVSERIILVYENGNRPLIEYKFYVREEIHPFLPIFIEKASRILKNNQSGEKDECIS